MGEYDQLADLLPEGVEVESIDPEELRDRIDAGEPVTILDVRAEGEYEKWHVEGEIRGDLHSPDHDLLHDRRFECEDDRSRE